MSSVVMTLQSVLFFLLTNSFPTLLGQGFSTANPWSLPQIGGSGSNFFVSSTGDSGMSGREGNSNLTNAFDVNDDGVVSPADLLILVQAINTGGCRLLPKTGTDRALSEGGSRRYFMDVNGDNYLSLLDVLLVINELNARQNGGNGVGK